MKQRAVVLTCWGCKGEQEVQLRSGRADVPPDVMILPVRWLWITASGENAVAERPTCPECLEVLRRYFPHLGKVQKESA